MKLIFLGFTKDKLLDENCVVEFTTRDNPLIISTCMKYKDNFFEPGKECEGDVKFFYICWSKDSDQITNINKSCFPFTFISSAVEELLEKKVKDGQLFFKYRTTLNGYSFEMNVATYDLKVNLKVGDRVTGLFRAKVILK